MEKSIVRMTDALTVRIAELAKLELTEAEVQLFTRQLEDILQYVAKIQEVNVAGVEPLLHPLDLKTPLRPDQPSSGPSKILACAPEIVQGSFKVPQIM